MNDKELLNEAITLLAYWCLDIEKHGASWDDWDENYKNANYRGGPLRQLIDAKKEELKNQYE